MTYPTHEYSCRSISYRLFASCIFMQVNKLSVICYIIAYFKTTITFYIYRVSFESHYRVTKGQFWVTKSIFLSCVVVYSDVLAAIDVNSSSSYTFKETSIDGGSRLDWDTLWGSVGWGLLQLGASGVLFSSPSADGLNFFGAGAARFSTLESASCWLSDTLL